MKRIIIALLFLMLIPFYAQAWQGACTDLSETAEMVMTFRQGGLSASTIVNEVGPYIDEEERELFYDLVLISFHTPVQDTDEGKIKAINEYRDMWFFLCADALRSVILGDGI